MVTTVPTRFSRIDCRIGPTLNLAIVTEIDKKKATHICLHSNKIQTLDLYVSPQYLSKSKEEEALRTGAHDLVYVWELDLSSNSLHEGYSLSRPDVAKKIPLLGLCTNLITLNLASNCLSQHSFSNLFGGYADEDDNFCLARLRNLDLSNNAFDELPRELHTKFPSLKNLSAANNKLKSLTSLLQSLHKLRGKLETAQFTSKSTGSANNPVCSKDLYREKVIFVLGSQLTRFDCSTINATDREKARLKLERGLSLYSENSADETHVHKHTPTSRGYKQPQHLALDQVECCRPFDLDHEDDGVLHHGPHHTVENYDAAAKRIRALEEQVASLTASIHVSEVVETRERDVSTSINQAVEVGVDEEKSSWSTLLESRLSDMCQRQRAAAMILLKTITHRQRQQKMITLHISFYIWSISTMSRRNALKSKEQAMESEKRWQIKTAELINNAINEEKSKSTRRLELSEDESKKKIFHLKGKVKVLEGRLEYSEASTVLKSDFQRMEEALKKDIAEKREYANLAELEADRLRKDIAEKREYANLAEFEADRLRRELQLKTEALDSERNGKISHIQRLTIANEKAMELVATNAAHLHQLKLEVIQKDETIKSIKDAYEHAAKRSAADRSRCEQALVSEQQTKDLLCRQSFKLQSAEAEIARVVADQQLRQTGLLLEIEEKDQKIKEAERKMKSILEENDDARKQLADCNIIKSRAEERNNYLEAQLDRAADDLRKATQNQRRKAKIATVDRQQLDESKSRAMDLKRSLDMLHESSQQREHELEAKHKENEFLRQSVTKYEKMVKSLSVKLQTAESDWEIRETQIESVHSAEIQKLRDQKDRELLSVNNDLKVEKGMRLELERKETDSEKQRLKMRHAIEGLANQLAGAQA